MGMDFARTVEINDIVEIDGKSGMVIDTDIETVKIDVMFEDGLRTYIMPHDQKVNVTMTAGEIEINRTGIPVDTVPRRDGYMFRVEHEDGETEPCDDCLVWP